MSDPFHLHSSFFFFISSVSHFWQMIELEGHHGKAQMCSWLFEVQVSGDPICGWHLQWGSFVELSSSPKESV